MILSYGKSLTQVNRPSCYGHIPNQWAMRPTALNGSSTPEEENSPHKEVNETNCFYIHEYRRETEKVGGEETCEDGDAPIQQRF